MQVVQPKQHFRVAYADACPEDSLLDGAPGRWHTVVAAMPQLLAAPPGLFESIDPFQPVANALSEHGFRLRKWSTSRQYQRRLRELLPSAAASAPFAAKAISFRERDARLLLNDILDRFELTALCETTIRDGRARFRLGPFIKDGRRDQFLEVPENGLAVLLLMADMLSALAADVLSESPFHADIPPVFLVWTDLISGDEPASTWRTGFLQHIIRRPPCSQNVSFQISPQNRPQLGDFLSDNLAGLLTDTLRRPSPRKIDSVTRLLASLPPRGLRWIWRTVGGAALLGNNETAPEVWLPTDSDAG